MTNRDQINTNPAHLKAKEKVSIKELSAKMETKYEIY